MHRWKITRCVINEKHFSLFAPKRKHFRKGVLKTKNGHNSLNFASNWFLIDSCNHSTFHVLKCWLKLETSTHQSRNLELWLRTKVFNFFGIWSTLEHYVVKCWLEAESSTGQSRNLELQLCTKVFNLFWNLTHPRTSCHEMLTWKKRQHTISAKNRDW